MPEVSSGSTDVPTNMVPCAGSARIGLTKRKKIVQRSVASITPSVLCVVSFFFFFSPCLDPCFCSVLFCSDDVWLLLLVLLPAAPAVPRTRRARQMCVPRLLSPSQCRRSNRGRASGFAHPLLGLPTVGVTLFSLLVFFFHETLFNK